MEDLNWEVNLFIDSNYSGRVIDRAKEWYEENN